MPHVVLLLYMDDATTQTDDQGQVQTPAAHVSTGLKEQGPHLVPEQPETQDLVTESVPEIELAPEVKDAGVEVKKDEPVILEEHEKAGIQPSGAGVPVNIPQDLKAWPLTKSQAMGILAVHKKVKESVAWLAMLILRQFKIAERKA